MAGRIEPAEGGDDGLVPLDGRERGARAPGEVHVLGRRAGDVLWVVLGPEILEGGDDDASL